MRRNKLLFILIPVILCVILLAVGGYVYLKLNSKPSKIFTEIVTKAFSFVETEEEKYYTAKTNLELSARVESAEADDEEIQEINNALEKSKVTINSQVDSKNLIANNNLKVVYDDENILDLTMLLQDEKAYVAVLDWLDKYIEIPLEAEDLEEIRNVNSQIDVNLILKSLETELINEIEKQEFTQAKTSLNLDGQAVSVTKTSLTLDGKKAMTFAKEILTNLKANADFQMALGQYREDVLNAIDEALEEIDATEEEYYSEDEVVFSIYTKGLFNQFVALEISVNNGDEGIELIKKSEEKYEFSIYNTYNGTREEELKVVVENKKQTKTKGTTVITIGAGDESQVIICNYEKKDSKLEFTVSTTIEEVSVAISGDFIKNGNKYSGNFTVTVEEPDFGKINLNALYEIVLNESIQKIDVSNTTTIDEMTEEEQEELMQNIQNSKLYELISESGFFGNIMPGEAFEIADSKEVKYNGKKVQYNVPEGFEKTSYSDENSKTYLDDDLNSITVLIDKITSEEYLKELEDTYVLTSSYYKDQQISDINTYMLGDKEYKYRSIQYKDDFAEYVNLYFVYELEDGYIYAAQVELQDSNMSLDKINEFLTITIK